MNKVVKVITICSAIAFVVFSCIDSYLEAKVNDVVLQDLEKLD